MLAKKSPTLIQGDRMRQNSAQLCQLHSRPGDYVMSNPQAMLTLNEQRMLQQKVEVLGHWTSEGILNRYYRGVRFLLQYSSEHLRRTRAREDHTGRLHAQSCFVTERARFTLDCDSHSSRFCRHFVIS
jgi:hypothetical protein